MAEHWCEIHNITFFKKGKMKGYAHPIGKTGEWCNEEEGEREESNETKGTPDKHPRWQRGSPEERSSIESQVAFKGAVELLVGKVIDLKSPLGATAINYAMSKLGNWSSMGRVVEQEPIDLPDLLEDKKKPVKKESSPPLWDEIKVELNNRLYKKAEGWMTIDDILAKLISLGGVSGMGSVQKTFETLKSEGKIKFAEMVKKANFS